MADRRRLLSLASTNAVKLGVIVVTAQVITPTGLHRQFAVDRTGCYQRGAEPVPSAQAFPLVREHAGGIAACIQYSDIDWAPVGAGVTGDVTFIGRGCPADSITPGSQPDPFLSNPAGKIA